MPSGFSKGKFYTIGNGSGYTITLYDSADRAIDEFILGKHYPYLGTRLNPNPPPVVPNAAYGAAAISTIPETSYSKVIGPSAQGGTGTEANPLVTDGIQSQALISSYPIWYVRAKVTAIAGATGTVEVWVTAIP